MKKTTRQIKSELTAPRKKETAIPNTHFVSTGSTLLNLACSGKTIGGLAKGFAYLIIGDSDSGKTWLTHTIMAEASQNENFANYRFIKDMPEHGANMDVESFFGKALAERLEPVAGTVEEPQYSKVLTDFYDNINRHLDIGPCIYLLDSMDALETNEDKAYDESKKSGKRKTGTFGTDKPKENSRRLRPLIDRLQSTGSMLFLISQTRQNMGFTAKFNPRTRSGGDALKFYSRIEMWMSIRERLFNPRHKNRQLGQVTKIKITKNHLCGWEGYVYVPFVRGHGIDDVGGCIDFLAEHYWPTTGKTEKKITAAEFDFVGKKEDLVAKIEEGGKEKKLRLLVKKVWNDIERKIKLKRKNKYQ